MKTHINTLERVAELPTDIFELSGELAWSPDAPVIKLRPYVVTAKPPAIATPRITRATHVIRTYHAWVIYPHVVCTPIPDLEVLAKLEPDTGAPAKPRHAGDLAGIAHMRHFYKLSRFHGKPLATPWGCEVRYGPWYATVTYTQSCDESADKWSLSSPVLGMQIDWSGTAADMPQVANLTAIWDPNGPAESRWDCCAEHTWCASSGSCLPNRIPCPPQVPL